MMQDKNLSVDNIPTKILNKVIYGNKTREQLNDILALEIVEFIRLNPKFEYEKIEKSFKGEGSSIVYQLLFIEK